MADDSYQSMSSKLFDAILERCRSDQKLFLRKKEKSNVAYEPAEFLSMP